MVGGYLAGCLRWRLYGRFSFYGGKVKGDVYGSRW